MNEYFLMLQSVMTDPLSFFNFFGYTGLALILFAETGLFCFFLPGDSLLITLGLISAEGDIDLEILIPTLIIATVLGDIFSYFLGHKYSDKIKKNMHLFFLEEKHLNKAHNFYEKHGRVTILISKFVAFVRTFAPFVAGTSKMNFSKFFIFDFVGAVIWVGGIVGGTHYLAQFVHFNIKEYFHYAMAFIGIIIISPFLIKYFSKFKSRN